MQASTGQTAAADRRPGVVGIHSVHRFVYSVPDLAVAEKFYTTFGMDVRRTPKSVQLYTFGNPHCWAEIFEGGELKRFQYVSYGIFADDEAAFRERIGKSGLATAPHPLSDGSGLWLRDPDGYSVQLMVAAKVSPSAKSLPTVVPPVPPGAGAAPARSRHGAVHPRRLSHILRFTPDVLAMVKFHEEILGTRLSDRSGEGIAFVHGVHGSDHHLVAFAKSHAPGLHHSSWDVGSVNEVGFGSENMRANGYVNGWGVGRHVLGSNYFYYVQDPWGSFCEYSYDIDFVPADLDWQAGDHPPEDSFYLWGPAVPELLRRQLRVSAGGAGAFESGLSADSGHTRSSLSSALLFVILAKAHYCPGKKGPRCSKYLDVKGGLDSCPARRLNTEKLAFRVLFSWSLLPPSQPSPLKGEGAESCVPTFFRYWSFPGQQCAKAGIQSVNQHRFWIPAFAGMTGVSRL